MNLPQARGFAPAWIALVLGGCALTDLDLDGGARVVESRIAAGDVKLIIDDTRPLALTLVYDDGFEETAPEGEVTWSLDVPEVAAIDGNHQLRGRSRGAAVLTGRFEEQAASAAVEVSDVMQAIEIRTSSRNCAVGQQLRYGALLRYQHGSTEDITARATWSSDAPQIASIDAGVVTGRGAGDTFVNAAFSSLTGSADVHISAAFAPGSAGAAGGGR